MILMVDNYDSFSYNIVHCFETMNRDVEVVMNDHDVESIDFSKYESIIISPGPSSPENAGITLDVIRRNPGLPLLGICLGMQAIVQEFGGRIVSAPEIVHGKQDVISHTGENLFKDIPQRFKAVRYHSLCAEKVSFPDILEIEAYSSDGVIQGISHRTLPVYGLQFHPESYMTEHGMTLLGNFLRICNA